MYMIARIESSTAWRTPASSSAGCLPLPDFARSSRIFASMRRASGSRSHWPSSAAVSSSEGCGGQSARPQGAPSASAVTSLAASPSSPK